MTSAMNFGDAMMQPHHCYGALKGQGTEGLLHMNDIWVRHELRIRVRILGYNSYIYSYVLLMMSHTCRKVLCTKVNTYIGTSHFRVEIYLELHRFEPQDFLPGFFHDFTIPL